MLTQNLLTQSWKALEHNSAVCRIHISLCSERLWSWDNIIILPRTYAIAPKYTKKHTNFQLIFGLLPRWFQDLRYSIWRALLVYFPSRAWHTFCPDTIFVGLTAQECAENQKTNCGCIFREFWRGWKDKKCNVLIFNQLWRYFLKTSAIVALVLSTRATKLQYSCC